MKDLTFNRLEVHGIKDYGDRLELVDDREADFWSMYGFVTAVNGSEFCVCIGDYSSRDEGELAAELLGVQ